MCSLAKYEPPQSHNSVIHHFSNVFEKCITKSNLYYLTKRRHETLANYRKNIFEELHLTDMIRYEWRWWAIILLK